MFSVLGCTVSLVTLGSRSTTLGSGERGGGIGGPSLEIPLQVVIAFKSPLGLATVLLGSEPEPEEEAEQLEFAESELDNSDFLDYFLGFDYNLDCTGFDYFAHSVEQNPVVEFG
ncbi:hypothetical protein Tco_0989125 [Tanacetum coccineum]|uniref:Uncharacterized protein n=1 Tax=Tanacetum coccineum TaxID=301880 RepID=A0ABQ5ESU3_9ASTR